MACEIITNKDGQVQMIICGRSHRRAPDCHFCHLTSTKLCDHPVVGSKSGKTCDLPICDRHATSVGPDRDFCPNHAAQREFVLEAS